MKFAEDKKSATIEFTTAMVAGDYTVSVSGLTEKALTGSVKVEAEKLTKINFLSDIAVISGNNIVTNVTAENQYGELITKKLNTSNTNITGTTSKGSSVSIDNDGRLTVAGTSGLFKADDKVVVTVVDSSTGVTATKTLTVAQAASVQSITTGEFKTDDEVLAAKPLNVANYDASKFYMPVEVKDQYGNVLKAADLNGSVTVTSSNKEILNPATTVFVDTDNGVVAQFQAAPTAQTYGTAVLTFVAAATGKTASASVTIKDNYKLDVVSLETPATELKVGKATELPVSITNTYGEQVALKDVTVGGSATALTLDTNTTINAIGANLSVVKDYINKKAVLKITPTAKNITLTLVTATGKSQVLSLTANDAPVVSGIKGVDADFVSLLANDASLSTTLNGHVDFVDQYGVAIDAPNYDATDATADLDYTIAPKTDSDVTTNVGGTISASTTAGNETYVVTLKKADGTVLDTQEVTVSVVDASKLTQFGISDANKFYTESTAAASYAQDLDIYGLVNGKKVLVNQDMAKDFTASNGLLGINALTGEYTPTTVDTDGKDVNSTIQVLVEAGTSTYVVTKDVVYSDATPKAASLAVELNQATAPAVVQATLVDGENIVTGSDNLAIFAKDQYGEVITDGYKFVITNNDTAQAISIDTDGTINIGGTLTSGKTFTINATIDGITKSVKVIVE
ncbi:hypothetical protein [Falsibacillus pallidus]|uniref:hypothetical protein n=1 Tax=Falsibacillus pallidus TaxID=493781 RepID=UPI003D961D94